MVKHFFRHLINGLRGKFIYPAFQKTRMKYKENVCWFRVQSVMEHLKEKLLGTKDQSLWPLFRSGREFENFQPWRDWNPFEINELWLPRTYLGFPFQQLFSTISFPIVVHFLHFTLAQLTLLIQLFQLTIGNLCSINWFKQYKQCERWKQCK